MAARMAEEWVSISATLLSWFFSAYGVAFELRQQDDGK